MWLEPGLKMVPGADQCEISGVLVPPCLGNWKQEVVVRPFSNQFCQLAGRTELAPKIGLSLNPLLELGDWDRNQS